MPNYIKLAMIFTKLAQRHGSKVLHGGNIDMLTRDLGDALRRQKKAITDPDLNIIETASEALPVMAEVKVLTLAVTKKLGLDTKGKSSTEVLEEILAVTEGRNSNAAAEIKASLEWTRAFNAIPEVQEIQKAELIQIELPKGFTDIFGMGKTLQQSAQRVGQEYERLLAYLERAKNPPAPKKDDNGPKI